MPDSERSTSLDRALDILEAFAHSVPVRSLASLSEELGSPKSTVHRLLRNLESRGYVEQDPASRDYQLGLRVWEVGARAIASHGLDEHVRPVLRRLSETTREQATAWIFDAGDVVCVQRSEGTQRVRSNTRLGTREPADQMAAGRAQLAFLDEGAMTKVVHRLDQEALDRLESQLSQVRGRGYAVSRGDRWPDVAAVAAPVRDHNGEVVAALSISGPIMRFSPEDVERIATDVVAGARELSRALGHTTASTETG